MLYSQLDVRLKEAILQETSAIEGETYGHSDSLILSRQIQTVELIKAVADFNDSYILSKQFHAVKTDGSCEAVPKITVLYSIVKKSKMQCYGRISTVLYSTITIQQ